MRVVIHQPDFMPYLGFFHRLLHADLWIVFDHVQFLSNSKSWHHRDKIKTPGGEKWLTVSVKKCPRQTPINEVMLSDSNDWKTDNLNLIRQNYRTAPYFSEIMPYVEQLYAGSESRLVEFNMSSIQMLLHQLDIKIPMMYSGSMSPRGAKNELLIDLLQKSNATNYLSGVGAKDYLQPELFKEAGIELEIQNFAHPEYPQLHGSFIPYLSTLDSLFNVGADGVREMIRKL